MSKLVYATLLFAVCSILSFAHWSQWKETCSSCQTWDGFQYCAPDNYWLDEDTDCAKQSGPNDTWRCIETINMSCATGGGGSDDPPKP